MEEKEEKPRHHKWEETNIGSLTRQWICSKCNLCKRITIGVIKYSHFGNPTEFKQCEI